MKKMKITLFTVASMALLMACGSPKTETTESTEAETTEPTALATEEDTDGLISSYMSLKDALVATNGEEAKAAAEDLSKLNLDDENLVSMAKAIAITNDVAVQRERFYELTTAFINYVKANGADQKLYVQFCPMAFDNTGANWVSLTSEIRNPYFGDMMLKCGRVDEEI